MDIITDLSINGVLSLWLDVDRRVKAIGSEPTDPPMLDPTLWQKFRPSWHITVYSRSKHDFHDLASTIIEEYI